MNKINDILNGKQVKDIIRIEYTPYSTNIAKNYWFYVANKFIEEDIIVGKQLSIVWSNLIKYAHADSGCTYKLDKAICLMGQTGSCKTKTMHILRDYLKIDNVHYKRRNRTISFSFAIHNAKDIKSDYLTKGFESLEKYLMIGNLCIDDLGSEGEDANHFGSKLNVLAEIIETRYNRGLLTHFTTNYNEELILKRYGRRVLSRMDHACNMIRLSDQDYRTIKQTK